MGISAVHSTRSAATNGLRRWSQTGIYPLNPSWLSDALVFIRQNINQNLSAADVYAADGKSHTIVDRAFMKALGTSVKQTIIRFRLEEAKHLIEDTTLPLSQVLCRAGFASHQHFSNSIAAAFGCSPTELRKKSQTWHKGLRN